jgi:glycosyltransferase involved in cell wall biosynthesis
VNDDKVYSETLKYIKNLSIPKGYKIEILNIKGASSITSGYNNLMKKTDAKYKVYLHQDTFVINKNFISDVINIFEKYPNIGMLGVAGSEIMPTDGKWYNSNHEHGYINVYDNHKGNMGLYKINDFDGDFKELLVIDGLIMITQYDVTWREDLFTGWHYYDVSQSLEFQRAGYKVAIPKQDKPWCIHDCGIPDISNGFEEYRKIFLNEYYKDIFPLVSVLIPAYNRPQYLEIALKSVLNQTYKNIEIIICDDSSNNNVAKMIAPYLKEYPQIRYIKNEVNLGLIKNSNKCLSLSTGEYINYLMDDDIFAHNKIGEMMNYFIMYDDISMVTSYRKTIDEYGNMLNDIVPTQRIFNETKKISGKVLLKELLKNISNFIGEPTTVLFRKKDLDNNFGEYNNKQYFSLLDVATWTSLLLKGDCVYIPETLSYFRLHENRISEEGSAVISSAKEWMLLIEEKYKDGFFSYNEFVEATEIWLNKVINVVEVLTKRNEKLDSNQLLDIYNYCNMIIKKLGSNI